ncbi:hypothetical protein ROM51_06200 [Cronobacter sakazakii]|uniref:hypothetical protein n=1 Tax=Cronobacter sakazakii TaxID=28141 RepID=UPI0011B07B13|nr:hypothetical protein [Cronobacter sakazakii]ELY2675088.1 hypothetical protein [Cronobacter sakazakii]MDK1099385.1 hypothetical protein [Cronobacter sakazakii]MDT3638176.1 hypothetical protein [Cronobacter sakazakii]
MNVGQANLAGHQLLFTEKILVRFSVVNVLPGAIDSPDTSSPESHMNFTDLDSQNAPLLIVNVWGSKEA